MSILEYNEITPKKVIVMDDGKPYVCLSSWVFRKQMRKPVNQTKLKNLITGAVIEHSFQQTDKAEEAELEKQDAKFIYSRNGEFWFTDPANPANRYTLSEDIMGDYSKFLLPNTVVEAKLFEEKIISVKMKDVKVALKVIDAPPSSKGDTVNAGNKPCKVETGAMISCPAFINTGDVILVNTDNGEYAERVSKA
jgi:elongation factor P